MTEVSILEQSVSVEGKPQSITIQDSINLAKTAEKLGYKRFWVSEHHNHPTIIGSAPEVLMAAMLCCVVTLKLAENVAKAILFTLDKLSPLP